MSGRTTKPKTKRASRASGAGKPAAKITKAANAGATDGAETASKLIDRRIRDLGGWRGETLARVRALIREADPEITEEWKWRAPRCGRITASSAPASRTRRL